MKFKKKMFMLGTAMLLGIGTISSASAYYYKLGTVYQRATHKDIPKGGGIRFNMEYGSKKVTNSDFATFKKIKADAWLGNYAHLVRSDKTAASTQVGIATKAKQTTLVNASINKIYFAAMSSSSLEPSNTCDTTVDFSADDLT